MENVFRFNYTLGHETPRNRPAVGKATPTGHSTVKGGQESVGGGPRHKRVGEFGIPLVPDFPSEGFAGATTATHSWPSAQALRVSETQTGPGAPEGTPGRRLSDGSMDLTARGQGDRPAVRSSVSPLPRLETSGKPRLELPETGAPRPATGRGSHPTLAAGALAPYKKTPKGLGPIWFFSMKAAFCSFPMSPAPGLRKGKRPSFTISTNGTEFLPSAPLPCPRKEGGWPFISSVAPGISLAWMSGPSSETCSGIFTVRWCCCGIGELSTGGKKSSNSFLTIRDSMSRSFRPMPQNSTPRNTFGIKPTAPSPTAHRRTSRTLKEDSETRCGGYEDPQSFFGPVSMLLICHGPGEFPLFMQNSIVPGSAAPEGKRQEFVDVYEMPD